MRDKEIVLVGKHEQHTKPYPCATLLLLGIQQSHFFSFDCPPVSLSPTHHTPLPSPSHCQALPTSTLPSNTLLGKSAI